MGEDIQAEGMMVGFFKKMKQKTGDGENTLGFIDPLVPCSPVSSRLG